MTLSQLRRIELIVLQGTPFCNLNCSYCDLSPESRKLRHTMSPELLETAFQQIFASDTFADKLDVIWHSGEPLTLKPDYYDDAIARILKCRDTHATRPVEVGFDIQTNAVLINDAWQQFFDRHRHHMSVGVSIDGPEHMHDAFRVNWIGRGSHAKALQGMQRLAEIDIKFKVIAVVTEATLQDPEAFFDFFWKWRDTLSGFHFNILASGEGVDDAQLTYTSSDRDKYYDFYRRLIELSRNHNAIENGFLIQNFTAVLSRALATAAPNDTSYFEQSSAPLKSLNIDARGNVTTFYAGLAPEAYPDQYGDGQGFSLGNLQDTPFAQLIRSPKLPRAMEDFATSRKTCAADCAYFNMCTGGFELTKLDRFGRFDVSETPECVIHVKTLIDAVLDDVSDHIADTAALDFAT